jgi:hypothetical protein
MERNGKTSTVIFGTLIAGVMGLQGWALLRIDKNSGTLASLTAIVESGKQARLTGEDRNFNDHQTILGKLDTLVNRREFDLRNLAIDSKFLSVEAEIKEVQARITKVEAQMMVTDTRFISLDQQLRDLKTRLEELKKIN